MCFFDEIGLLLLHLVHAWVILHFSGCCVGCLVSLLLKRRMWKLLDDSGCLLVVHDHHAWVDELRWSDLIDDLEIQCCGWVLNLLRVLGLLIILVVGWFEPWWQLGSHFKGWFDKDGGLLLCLKVMTKGSLIPWQLLLLIYAETLLRLLLLLLLNLRLLLWNDIIGLLGYWSRDIMDWGSFESGWFREFHRFQAKLIFGAVSCDF